MMLSDKEQGAQHLESRGKPSAQIGKLLHKYIYWTILVLALAQLVLILVSWLMTATMPDEPFRSLLSVVGIRWFFGNYTANMQSPGLVFLIVMAIAFGSIYSSGLWHTLKSLLPSHPGTLTSQKIFALKGSVLLLVLEAAVMFLLTALPHAVLVSITGRLFPSALSSGFIPTLAFMGTSIGVTFGLLSGKLRSVYEVGQCMCSGCVWLLPLLLLYIFAMLFYHSFIYVFNM